MRCSNATSALNGLNSTGSGQPAVFIEGPKKFTWPGFDLAKHNQILTIAI